MGPGRRRSGLASSTARCWTCRGTRSGMWLPCVATGPIASSRPPAACLPVGLALEPPGSTPGPDHVLEADQCGGDSGGAAPGLRGGPTLAEPAGASGGGPGCGHDPHPPAAPEGAEGPAALEGIAPSYQEKTVLGVI